MSILSRVFGSPSATPDDPSAGAPDQTEDERKLAAHVRQKVEECRASASRVAHEGIWMTNIAALLGFGGLSFNTTSRQFQPINRASSSLKKNRVHVNKILPAVQNRLARLCKNPPRYDVRPESNSTDDKEAARLSLQVLQCLWEKLTLNKKRIPLYMWVQQCGHSWGKVSWDVEAGKFMQDPITGEAGFEGDVRFDVVSAFEIFPDPYAKTDDDLRWLIQAKVRRLEYFKAHYPEKGGLVKAEDAWLLSAQYEDRVNSINSRGPSQGGMESNVKDSAIEMIKYEAPSKDYPKGRMIVAANGILLEDKELFAGEIPFAKFDDILIGGKFYSESVITHLRPIQDQSDETIRRRGEWIRQLLAGKYVAFRGSNLSQESLNDQTGEILMVDPVPNAPNGGMPMPMQIPALPEWAYKEEEKCDEHIDRVSGLSDVSRGELPSASIPALGMQILVEQDDTRIGVITEGHEHGWAKIGRLILKHVETGYAVPRKLKIAGKSSEYNVIEVVGSSLKGNTDVTVTRGSTQPGNKTLQRQEILNTYSQGLLGPQGDPKVIEQVLGMIEFGDSQALWEDFALDMAQIKRGMDALEQGMPIPVDELDNHPLWILEMNRFRKGDKFEALPPQIQDLFRQTIEAHIQAIMKLSNSVPPPIDPSGMGAPESGELPGAPSDGGAPTDGEAPPLEEPMQPLPGGP